MKAQLKTQLKALPVKTGLALAFVLLASQAALASPYLPLNAEVADKYVGGHDHGWGDIVGTVAGFDVSKAAVSIVGNNLSVTIFTNFVKTTGAVGKFTGITQNYGSGNNPGIAYGDFFLADSWNPYVNAQSTAANGYLKDNKFNGTNWDYGFSIDAASRKTPNSGSGTWYDLQGDVQNSAVLASESFISSGTYRNGQAIAVNRTASNINALLGNNNSFVVDRPNGTIKFTMNLAGTALENASTIAFRWAMTCGNDAIEGSVTRSAPEPAQWSLFGLGLAGLSFLRKRKVLSK
jgi:hypothetical protein